MNLGNPPDAEQRAKFAAAVSTEEYGAAFGAYQLGLMRRALALLGQEHYILDWKKEPTSTLEFAGGIVAALDHLIETEGDQSSYRLLVVRDVIAEIAHMQELLTRDEETSREPSDMMALAILQGVRLGNVEIMLGQTEGGFLDEYANLKWREVLDHQRRQKGASTTNEGKAQQRSKALHKAQEIAKINPTLSNDDLAYRVKQGIELPHAIRTVTGWIRGWRQDGRLPPLR